MLFDAIASKMWQFTHDQLACHTAALVFVCRNDQERRCSISAGSPSNLANISSGVTKLFSNLPMPFSRQKAPSPGSEALLDAPPTPSEALHIGVAPERSMKSRLGPQEGFMPVRIFGHPHAEQPAIRRNVAEACESGSGRADLWLLAGEDEGGSAVLPPSHWSLKRKSSAEYSLRSQGSG